MLLCNVLFRLNEVQKHCLTPKVSPKSTDYGMKITPALIKGAMYTTCNEIRAHQHTDYVDEPPPILHTIPPPIPHTIPPPAYVPVPLSRQSRSQDMDEVLPEEVNERRERAPQRTCDQKAYRCQTRLQIPLKPRQGPSRCMPGPSRCTRTTTTSSTSGNPLSFDQTPSKRDGVPSRCNSIMNIAGTRLVSRHASRRSRNRAVVSVSHVGKATATRARHIRKGRL